MKEEIIPRYKAKSTFALIGIYQQLLVSLLLSVIH
jgi:hypothetical protein